jgi:hypothetical protein
MYCVPAETRPTIMEVLVEDDWTSTVTSTPIITPTTGFCIHKGTVSQEYISHGTDGKAAGDLPYANLPQRYNMVGQRNPRD